MRAILELLRIIVIMGVLGSLGWVVISNIYKINDGTEPYSWLGVIAVILLVFIG